EAARWAGRFGAASAVVALALYGVLQAVDGVANKQVDDAWVAAPAADKAARFASAEAIRWLEWGGTELPGLRAARRSAPGRGCGCADGVGRAADCLPDGALRPHL